MDGVAIIVAAGRGLRAGEGGPKQYRLLDGRPLLAHAVERFLACPAVTGILCVIHPDDHAAYEEAVSGLAARAGGRLLAPVHGGATRQDSVRSALEALAGTVDPDGICLVHDAARPFVSTTLIERAIEAARRHGAAVPGSDVTDTVKRVDADGQVVETLPRDRLRAVQTPQAFRFGLIAEAHRRAAASGVAGLTDDGHVAEWSGAAVHVFEGEGQNVKITHASDLETARARLAGEPALVVKVGTGFDVHAFREGDHVWLGGLRLAHDRGVLAHSDGDVVLHALTDALLGTTGDGDIGTHFPPSDERWRGAASERFLAHACALVRERGGRIDHLDVTVLCERPRIGPHREAMRARIAAICAVPVGAVSIKATTTEQLGFTGRREGLAAQAAATVRLPEAGS